MSVFEINNLDWFNSLSPIWRIITIAAPCLAICIWCKLKYTGKYIEGFKVVDCDEYGMDIPTGVLLVFIFPPFGGVIFVFMFIVQPIASVIFTAILCLIFYLWVLAGDYAQTKK